MDVNFTALAPRYGTHPLMGIHYGLGTSGMNGGAFNWGNVWSGIKSFGNTAKGWANKAWNSSTGHMLRQKLQDTKVQEKIVDGLSTGIHGAIDLAQQEITKAIEKKLERPLQIHNTSKRPREDEEEEIIIKHEEPPSYSEAIMSTNDITKLPPPYQITTSEIDMPSKPPASQSVTIVSKPVVSKPVMPKSTLPKYRANSLAQRGWQSTLNNIVGVGVQSTKRRRCY